MSVHDRLSLVQCVGEAEALRVAARKAEDEGDFKGALRLVRGMPGDIDTRSWRRQLARAIALPSSGPQVSRWLVHPALRWALERPAAKVLEAYARLMLTILEVPASARTAQMPKVLAADAVVVDAALFDGGLFEQYLSSLLGSSLLARAGPVERWSSCPASVWTLEHQAPDHAVVRDCWTGVAERCLTTKESIELPSGVLFYGRLVPVEGAVGLAFALAPVVVDKRCAARVVRARQA